MTRTMSQAERQAWLDEARYTANAMAAASLMRAADRLDAAHARPATSVRSQA